MTKVIRFRFRSNKEITFLFRSRTSYNETRSTSNGGRTNWAVFSTSAGSRPYSYPYESQSAGKHGDTTGSNVSP